jgi:hypothetical protein
MLSKKKKRRAIYIAVGSTVLMAVVVGAGVFLCKKRRRSQSVHPNSPGARSNDNKIHEGPPVDPTHQAQGAKHSPHVPKGTILAGPPQPDITTPTPSSSRTPPRSPRSLGNPDSLIAPAEIPVTQERKPLNDPRIEETPAASTGAGCSSTGDTPQSLPAAQKKFTRNKHWYLTLSLGADYATNDKKIHTYPERGNILASFEPTDPSNEEQSLREMQLALELLNPTYQSPSSTTSTQSLHLLLGWQRQ